MKFRFEHLLLIMALASWAIIAWVVVDYNLGLGSTTLHWPNPAHPTAAWTWDAREATPTVLEPQTGQWLRVTLPRGFDRGILSVNTNELTELTLKAEPKVSQLTITEHSQGRTHQLQFAFTDLVARGKTFRFRLENTTNAPVSINTISLSVTR